MTPQDQQRVEAFLQIVENHGTLHNRFADVKRVDPIGGGGAFSLVFTARDLNTGSEVVLKFFRPDRFTPGDAYRWQSFERESKLLDDLKGCRDIISLVCGQQEFDYQVPTVHMSIKFAYYAMEKAQGSLADVIAAGNASEEDLLLYFRAAVRAVQRIHTRKIGHRDMKPSNFLMTNIGLKLSDFGTARQISDGASAIVPVYFGPPGDVNYVSPEMMACLHDVDPNFCFPGDFFALGAVLFEMFTGLKLGVNVFGPQLLTALIAPIINVARDQRISIYNQVVGAVASNYPLPNLESFNPSLRPCVRQRLNALYKDLCTLDYRNRLTNYSTIFRGIDTCLLIIRNEARILAWQQEKQKRRAARMAKLNGVLR
jgi:serine/threonine protein kinase